VAALLLAATGTAHALKPGTHADIAKASCLASGLPRDLCTRAATEDYDTDSNEWDDLRAHAQIDDGETACVSADRTAGRMWQLGNDTRLALSAVAVSGSEDNVGKVGEALGRALHTIQDDCAHHGMPNPQHAWFSLGDFCDGTETSPDLQADAISCARVESDALMAVAARAVNSSGTASRLAARSCPPAPQSNSNHGNSAQTALCQKRYLPGPIDACSFLGRAKDWDGIDRTWNNAVVAPALREAFAAGLAGEPALAPICGGDETVLSAAVSQPIVDVSVGAPSCGKASFFCLGKADDSENPFADDPAPDAGGCSATGDRSGAGALLGVLLVMLARRRRSQRGALVALVVAAGCAQSPPVTTDPGETGGGGGSGSGSGSGSGNGVAAIPDVRCTGTPDAGPAGAFNHLSSELIAALGSPKHRGIDLIVPASASTQMIEGDAAYTIADKALEDEDVDVFACRQSAWQKLGTARTDSEGHFVIALQGADRLPIGMRDMYVSVVGDRTGSEFLGLVAPDGAKLLVSDVDGTLTSSENAFTLALVTGNAVDARAGAAMAYAAVAAKGYTPVYLTARGNQYTDATRTWLTDHGFPRGPLHLAPSFVTLPGSSTVAFKTDAMLAIGGELELAAGVGNRASDVEAYTMAGVAADRIFIELPDYQAEVQPDLDAHEAVGFQSYDDLRVHQFAAM
jgi:uncharacterized protein (TIGR03382 family)